MASSFRPNQAGLRALANGPEMRAMVAAKAEAGQRYAEGIAPRRTDRYASSFGVSTETSRVGRFERVIAVLANTAPYAAAVEWGNSRNGGRGQRILGKTAAALRSL